MAEQPEPKKRKRHLPRKEHPSYPRRNISESVPHTADHAVLKQRRPPLETALLLTTGQVPVPDERNRQPRHFRPVSMRYETGGRWWYHDMSAAGDLRRNGNACRTHHAVSKKPARQMSWGAKKRQKTAQSRYDTGPRFSSPRLGGRAGGAVLDVVPRGSVTPVSLQMLGTMLPTTHFGFRPALVGPGVLKGRVGMVW